jgi:hypothetical protein
MLTIITDRTSETQKEYIEVTEANIEAMIAAARSNLLFGIPRERPITLTEFFVHLLKLHKIETLHRTAR